MVRDENGDVLYYEGTLTDVTERIRVENQLRQSQKMEALGHFAGGIARDFRGVCAGIVTGLKQALNVLPENSSARPPLNDVAKKMDSAEALTRQILEFSSSATVAVFDLNALVVGMETGLELSLCGDPAPVLADAGHIRQVVVSLLIQARELGGGSNKITIATAIEAQVPATVSLSVHSTARAAEVLPWVSTAWVGMATSQAILAQYGGTITAAIEPVRYSLCLPLATGTRLVPPAAHATSKATVLFVEEDPLIRELGRDMLERQGFQVLTTVSAAEAEHIRGSGQAIDVLIANWTPNAERLVHLLRETRPELRVLYLTGHPIPAPAGSAVLQKPFSGDSLGRTIRALLRM